MSDNYLKLIPADSYFVPDESTHQEAITLLEALTPDGEEVEVEIYEQLTFIDQGQNLEAIICPSCNTVLNQDHYSEDETDCEKIFHEIDNQSEGGVLESGFIKMPCCSTMVKTIDLKFNWPAGFSKFELSALNPEIERPLNKDHTKALSEILGCELIEIWAHY